MRGWGLYLGHCNVVVVAGSMQGTISDIKPVSEVSTAYSLEP